MVAALWLGHANAAVLDGGWQAWLAQDQPVESAVSMQAPGDFAATAPLVGTKNSTDIAHNLQTGQYQLINARAADRYRGENETLDPVGGHIPGALNRFFRLNLQADGRFKPAAALRDEFRSLLGPVSPSRTVLQCGSGVSACDHALAMQIAGLEGASLYPGSWSEWCADPSRPIATGAQP